MINDYYTLSAVTALSETEFLFEVRLNASCAIYEGHFPGQPVAPGACQVQIIKECAERALQRPVRLKQIKQCKFLKTIIPAETPSLDVHLLFSEPDILTAEVRSNETIYVKLKSKI